ncbi:MAG: DNA-3-methyladenine glycosylase I [Candidatus Atribacteria bacterium]|nr:DNA-3-methyladenine glycosylase I [Candidatus Atribacteria bacterium]
MENNINLERCPWCLKDEMYIKYHDEEWGVPVFEDRKQFEFIVLESAQAGLSWYTVLSRRERYREAYLGFDPEKVANFKEKDVEKLLNNPGIIRNRMKIEASVTNAKAFMEIGKEFGSFSKYIWSFVDGKPVINGYNSIYEIPAETELSLSISKDLKKRGFRFFGPKIVYAHLQAVGIVNDHIRSCFRYKELTETF